MAEPRIPRSWETVLHSRGPIALWRWLAEHHDEFSGPIPEDIADDDYDGWRRVIAERIER